MDRIANPGLWADSTQLDLRKLTTLGNPNVVIGSIGFGSITSAGDPRVVQFGLKLNF